jgi:hypothetical protein
MAMRFIYAKPREEWIVGLDVGQSIDPSAVCVLNHQVIPGSDFIQDAKTKQ